jgi:hypothetical protein
MENTAQWIFMSMVLATDAVFIHCYKTGAVLLMASFGLAMLPHGGIPFGPGQAAAVPVALLAALPAVLTWAWPVIAIVGLSTAPARKNQIRTLPRRLSR